MKFIQAYIEKIDESSLKIFIKTLNLGSSDFSVGTESFILPNDRTKLQNLPDEVYRTDAPKNINKSDFKNKITQILNLSVSSVDIDTINKDLKDTFSKGFDTEDLLAPLTGGLDASLLEVSAEALNRYEATQETVQSLGASRSPGLEGEGEDNYKQIYDDLAETLLEAGVISQADYDEAIESPVPNPDLLNEINNQIDYYNFSSLDYEDEDESFTDGEKQKLPSNEFFNEALAEETISNNPIAQNIASKPTVGNQRPVVDYSNLSVDKMQSLNNLPPGLTEKFKGISGERLIEPVPTPIYHAGDAFLASENNSGITCSRDEQYKMRGHTRSGAVYIYAGRDMSGMEPNISEDDTQSESNNIVFQPNNLVSDSSYIYLSQKADVDTLLRVAAPGTYGKKIKKLSDQRIDETRTGLSLVAMKADDIVLMSRVSGIRLITGTDSKNSRGAEQTSSFGIDLIAGNDDSDLQPLVKGTNLKTYLQGLSKVVDGIRAVLMDFLTSQLKFNAAMAKHRHYDPYLITLAFMSTSGQSPLAFNEGKNFASPEATQAFTVAGMEGVRQQANIVSVMMNKENNDNNAFSPIGPYRILSPRNRTN